MDFKRISHFRLFGGRGLHLCVVTILSTALLSGCSRGVHEKTIEPKTDFSHYREFTDAIGEPDAVVIYEGLPSDFDESELFERELKRAETLEIDSEPFYAERIKPLAADADRLTLLFSKGNVTAPFTEGKECGGFHADYAVEWKKGDTKYRALICFGCGEVIALGPKIDLIVDMTADGERKLGEVLSKYRKNRPEPFSGVYESWSSLHLAKSTFLHRRLPHALKPRPDSVMKFGDYVMMKTAEQIDAKVKAVAEGILLDKASFRDHVPKKCRFNPDFAVSWPDGDWTKSMLVCLTCEEVKFDPGEYETHLDLSREAAEKLRELFAKK